MIVIRQKLLHAIVYITEINDKCYQQSQINLDELYEFRLLQ